MPGRIPSTVPGYPVSRYHAIVGATSFCGRAYQVNLLGCYQGYQVTWKGGSRSPAVLLFFFFLFFKRRTAGDLLPPQKKIARWPDTPSRLPGSAPFQVLWHHKWMGLTYNTFLQFPVAFLPGYPCTWIPRYPGMHTRRTRIVLRLLYYY